MDLNEAAREALSGVEYWVRHEEADRSQIVRLFQNLLSNGLKYHNPGQRPNLRSTGKRRPSRADA